MAPKQDKTTFKYGQPLFCAAWPRGNVLLVGGGGGKPGSGIANRVVAAQFKDGELSDEIASVHLKQPCDKLVIAPKGRLMLVAAGRGVLPYDVHFNGSKLEFVVPQGAVIEALLALKEESVKAMAFSSDGAFIAFGTAAGSVHIWQYKGLKCLHTLHPVADGASLQAEVKEVDVAIQQGHYAAVAVADSGDCYLWRLGDADAGGQLVGKVGECAVLAKPKDMANCMIKHCRFLQTTEGGVICSMNYRGDGFVGRWQLSSAGSYSFVGKSGRMNPVTGMDVSNDGSWVAVCTSEGEAFMLDAQKLRVQARVKKAHMVFATGATFAADSNAFVSTSADASARVVLVPAAGSNATVYLLMLILFVLLLALLWTQSPEFRAQVKGSWV